MKTALITGITGQDGAYLADFLLSQGYKVYGAYRRVSSQNFWRLTYLNIFKSNNLKLVEMDLTDLSSIINVIKIANPDEIYNLGAQSFVGTSFLEPISTAEISAIGVVNMLEAIRLCKPDAKFYQASTSEMFGKVQEVPQNELTPFYPRSPYAVAKLYGHWITVNYREAYGIHATSGILFNHESPLRGLEFVTRKITNSVAKLKLGLIDSFELGNIDSKRDWGYAKEYVEGMYKIINHVSPETFVLSYGETATVRFFIEKCFDYIGDKIIWSGQGLNEIGVSKATGNICIKINPEFYRPAEVDLLVGDAKKAHTLLGWKPLVNLNQLTEIMMDAEFRYHIG